MLNPLSIFGNQDQKDLKIRVSLSVSGDSKDEIYSYMARELRSLNDVLVSENEARFELHVVAIFPQYTTGVKTGGISIATTILDNYAKFFVSAIVSAAFKDKPELKKLADNSIQHLTTFTNIWINTGSLKEMKRVCESIIAQFDTQYLENVRKNIQKIRENITQEVRSLGKNPHSP